MQNCGLCKAPLMLKTSGRVGPVEPCKGVARRRPTLARRVRDRLNDFTLRCFTVAATVRLFALDKTRRGFLCSVCFYRLRPSFRRVYLAISVSHRTPINLPQRAIFCIRPLLFSLNKHTTPLILQFDYAVSDAAPGHTAHERLYRTEHSCQSRPPT